MEQIESLARQLEAFKAGFGQRVTPERVATMEAATAQLKASGIEQQARQAGDQASDVALPDALGNPVRLSDLWNEGPLVVIFYRGGWCPYCNLELRAWQRHLDRLAQLGAKLVAVSPQTPDNSLSTAEKNSLVFPVLSDSSLEAAYGFRIAFSLPPELVDLYGSVGHDLPAANGNRQWVLPIPATFVIDREGAIRFAHLEADYRQRAEPAEVLAVVERIASVASAG